jgi:hypothetical protein
MRAIMRFSINGEGSDTYLAMAIRKQLEDHGFRRRGTGSWENDNIGAADLSDMMRQYWEWVANPQSVANVRANVVVDHVWFYTDLPE